MRVIAWLLFVFRRHPLNTEIWLTLVCLLHYSFFQKNSISWKKLAAQLWLAHNSDRCFPWDKHFVMLYVVFPVSSRRILKDVYLRLRFNKTNFYSSRHFYVKLGFLLVWFGWNLVCSNEEYNSLVPLSWRQYKAPAISPTVANVNTMKEGKNVLVLLSKLSDFVQPQKGLGDWRRCTKHTLRTMNIQV